MASALCSETYAVELYIRQWRLLRRSGYRLEA